MEFSEAIKQFAKRAVTMVDAIGTEEATKTSLIMPLFQILGYDVFNPLEFCPEFVADVGIKKGEKIDYAILENGEPTILIECKSCKEDLDKHSSQLFRYFGTSKAKFGILTNGIIYRFYTDLEESNKMDLVPFLEVNLQNLKDSSINELRKFCKDNFDRDKIFSTAEELKYTSLIRDEITKEYDSPTDEFVRLIIGRVYDGQRTQKVIDKFTPLVKKAFSLFMTEIVNSRISSALDTSDQPEETDTIKDEDIAEDKKSNIITTQDEIESFYIVRGILAGVLPIEDIAQRDTESYFGILYKDNNRKPLCRINLDHKVKYIYIPDSQKNFERFPLETLNDIYKYKDKLLAIAQFYAEN